MKIYMSYWSGGYQKEPSENIIDLHRVSSHYAKKHYEEVTLITNTKSKPLFESCSFTNITTDLDCLNEVTNKNWALGKLYAYKFLAQKREPFLHIDYDVFLMEPIQKQYETAKVLVQSQEVTAFKNYQLKKFYDNIGENTDFTEPDSTHIAYNMGIFGGTEYDFIEEYAQKAIDFTLNPKNEKTFEIMHQYKSWAPACILEQYYLWYLANKKEVEVTRYLEGDDYSIEGKILMEVEAVKKGYVHLMTTKNSLTVVKKIKEIIKEISKEEVNV